MAAEIAFPVGLVYRKVGPGAVLAEALFFPELSRLAANRALAASAVRRNLIDLVPKLKTDELLRRRRATAARELTFTLLLDPPRANEAWRDPLELTFHAVAWDHPRPATSPQHPSPAPGAVLARVAELGIEVIAAATDDLLDVLRRETFSALRRMNLSVSLRTLAPVQSTQAFEAEWTQLPVRVPSLKDRAIRSETEGDAKQSLLQQVATQLKGTADPAYEAEATVDEVEKALTANPPQSVLLVGPSGVGKTAAVRQLARRWDAAKGRPPVFLTSGARIVAGQTGFGMWEQRCQDLVKEAAKRRAVLHVGSLVELMEVGKSEHNHSGIATFLRPAIARGELLCVAEVTPEQLPLIEKQDPQLLDAFRHVTVGEPDEAKGRAILSAFAAAYSLPTVVAREAEKNARRKRLRRRALERSKQSKPAPVNADAPAPEPAKPRTLSPEGLAAIDRLHRRYATYSAYPGRPLRFLENLLRDGPRESNVTEEEVYAAFTRETGLPRAVIDPAVPLDVADTHGWFSARVVGQADAVNLVVDLLATVKAGLTRPNRPIASLLFIGPTGVGKTEMAKALAEFLFGSKDRLTRFDMSEYADPVSVRRLVGGVFGSEGLLTAKVREQPFSVLLLDEVEKAHGSFFDLLLQALGEARLTDAGGRLADFRNTVVILTSNLGAESYRRGSTGFVPSAPGAGEATDHFTRAVEQFLRPEMFNRLDRVVPFAPLGAGTIRRIADREWQKVLNRDGVRFREVKLATAPGLLDHLAAVGFDPRYGARPLKRAMERELLAPLARQMNRHPGDVPLTVDIGIDAGAPAVAVRPVQGPRGRSNREPTGPAGKLAAAAQAMRRWHQLVAASSTVRELDNEVYQLALEEQRIYQRQQRGKKVTAQDADALARLGRLREVADEVRRQRDAAVALEDDTVIAFHDGFEPTDDLAERLADGGRDWDRLLLRLYGLNAPPNDSVTLALFAEHRGHLTELAAAYRAVATDAGLGVQGVRFDLPTDRTDPTPPPPRPVRNVAGGGDPPPTEWYRDRLFATSTGTPKLLLTRTTLDLTRSSPDYHANGTLGLALTISGAGAHVRFSGEGGLHAVRTPDDAEGGNPDVLAFVSSAALPDYRPPEAVVRKGLLKDRDVRREYDLGKGTMRDFALDRTWTALHGHLTHWVEPAVTANMRLRLLKLIVE
ncbi:b family protein : ATP-dependent Clp protease, ATP-binding subunit ClpC, putative OS=Microscilla marina ATCC 23134 GN=M23134_01764 PE=4 SV=1: AAA_16: AAA_2: ClpB_D2-small [Gemmataceae bacterium]|nr:b family protein : ATP-dependent Clp protease, ATP-binding subunit ClpC, putative OS=Microscilla marina ATCC 23134 GN=M23134_01764 PE=4 SV=1: AAA_16: AAA_2: ClpB_D2-small [Gemmataceae bacterium]VTU01872.1 b family protein : ATP-dependent Clp protease, ATP-binding subunit ClpC, putative OS=Microscilla marina ATCC 23134 GN=M23134_01764 PE=4 SV=1: AAA_16: AAA_2: ClpB_D2-small [Gemmataceae bacterium]